MINKNHMLFILADILILFTACTPLVDYRQLLERDLQPPSFTGISIESPKLLHIFFSENVILNSEDLFIVPMPPDYTIEIHGRTISLKFTDDLIPGGSYKLKTTVKDSSGNTLTLINSFYGFNPDLPVMLLNEFTSQGSAANPDRVEIAVLTDGNTAGAVIYEGTDLNWEQRKIFPAINVTAGDFIIIHFKSTGDPEEIDETESKDASGGVKPSDEAWDLWIDAGTGLSGNNGTITLFTALYGSLTDGLLYSNRTSESDEKYRGFGSLKVMDRADRLAELSGWETEDNMISPEDGINPDDSTATRSICRNSFSSDSNAETDWHIVPTSTSSFGLPNSDLVYVP